MARELAVDRKLVEWIEGTRIVRGGAGMGWLRLYTEIRNDRKLRRLPPGQRWLWVVIMTIAKESPRPGWLLISEDVPVTLDDLSDEAAIPIEEVEAGLKAFVNQKMIENIDGVFHLLNWDKRQFASDSSTERVKKYRSNQKNNSPTLTSTETLQKRFSNNNETPPDYRVQSTYTETDQKIDPSSVVVSKDQTLHRGEGPERDAVAAATDKKIIILQKSLKKGGILAPSGFEIERLLYWHEEGIEIDAICYAIEKAALAGNRRVSYIEGIMKGWNDSGITTKAQAIEADNRFEEEKNTKRIQARSRGDPKKEHGLNSPIDEEKKKAFIRSLYV